MADEASDKQDGVSSGLEALVKKVVDAIERSHSGGFQRVVQYGVDESGKPVAMPIREDGLSTTGGSTTGSITTGTVAKLAAVSLGTSATEIYTATGDVTDMSVVLCNVDSSARTFTLYHCDSSGSAADSNTLFHTYNLRPGASVQLTNLGMASGEIIKGLCSSSNKVTASLYGTVV